MIHIVPFDRLSSGSFPPDHPELQRFDLEHCRAHRCDAHAVAIREDVVVARASLWWNLAPALPGKKVAVAGHFSAVDIASAQELLEAICGELRSRGCDTLIGPMDGNTWRRYRFLTERGSEPPFFLEPDNPDPWPQCFERAAFVPLATYFSALNEDLKVEDERIPRTRDRLKRGGIELRQLDPNRFVDELRRIHAVSTVSFRDNFLYTPIADAEFIGQYEPLRVRLRPELVMLAERAGEPVGFVFGIPDLAQAGRGQELDTVVLKTVAVLPGRAYAGLGNVLVAACQQAARALGFRRVIHALMHESNNSLNLSGHYARPFRRYTLYVRHL